jgi:hypothetical protein
MHACKVDGWICLGATTEDNSSTFIKGKRICGSNIAITERMLSQVSNLLCRLHSTRPHRTTTIIASIRTGIIWHKGRGRREDTCKEDRHFCIGVEIVIFDNLGQSCWTHADRYHSKGDKRVIHHLSKIAYLAFDRLHQPADSTTSSAFSRM